tara:strand:- start:703 stop:1560 length:858 start_codon:yes stop_codon:yes gene_type:complete
MLGIIANDGLAVVGHSLFNNFRLGLQNYFEEEFRDVANENDLDGIDTLFIVDEHFTPHVSVWKQDAFINKLNISNIKTVVFNFEKIFDSKFPWNVDHQNKLCTIQNLIQIVSDVNDADTLNKTIINKQFLSRDTKLDHDKVDRIDRILFLGQSDKVFNPSYAYSRRYQLLEEIKQTDLPVDIVVTDRALTYREYLTKLASYKYILNPLGTGEFVNLRFYEALKVGCIPIQQITLSMIPKYHELLHGCHTFIDSQYIKQILKYDNVSPRDDFYIEDYFKEINLKNL